MWHHVALSPLFHSSDAVVLAFLIGVLVLRRFYRPRRHWVFRPLAYGGALLAASAWVVGELSCLESTARTVLVGGAILTLALYGEVAMSMRREADAR